MTDLVKAIRIQLKNPDDVIFSFDAVLDTEIMVLEEVTLGKWKVLKTTTLKKVIE